MILVRSRQNQVYLLITNLYKWKYFSNDILDFSINIVTHCISIYHLGIPFT